MLAEHISRIPNGEAAIGVDDDLPDASLFLVDIVSGWVDEICHYFATRLPIGYPWTK